MLKDLLARDPVLRFLASESSFSETQLDTYLTSVIKEARDLSTKISLRDRKPVSKGSYLRTLRQAQMNLRRAFFTILVAEYLMLVEEGSSAGILRAAELLAQQNRQYLDSSRVHILIKTLENIARCICPSQ